MQQPLVIKQGSGSGQVNMQPGMVSVPMTMSSSMSGSIPNVMTLNKPGGQNVVVTSQNLGAGQPGILPNVQILNMRPGTPTVAAQKSVATVSPRVVIGTPQGARAAAPGITLQTLQSLQPGQQGHLLLKTENGQYQLLRVGPAPATSALAAPPSQNIRLSTVPAHPGVPTVSTSAPPPSIMANQSGNPGQLPNQQLTQMPGPQPGQHQGSQPVQLQGLQSIQFQGLQQGQLPVSQPGQLQQMAPVAHALGSAPPTQTSIQNQPSNTTYVKPSDNTKEKCRNFLANLLDLSSKEPPSVEMNVRNLIQELIDAKVEPEEFCDRLERLLNASPQPCLIGFLKKSLPLLRQSLMAKELTIEGIKPPEPAPFTAYMNAQLPVPKPKAAPTTFHNLSPWPTILPAKKAASRKAMHRLNARRMKLPSQASLPYRDYDELCEEPKRQKPKQAKRKTPPSPPIMSIPAMGAEWPHYDVFPGVFNIFEHPEDWDNLEDDDNLGELDANDEVSAAQLETRFGRTAMSIVEELGAIPPDVAAVLSNDIQTLIDKIKAELRNHSRADDSDDD